MCGLGVWGSGFGAWGFRVQDLGYGIITPDCLEQPQSNISSGRKFFRPAWSKFQGLGVSKAGTYAKHSCSILTPPQNPDPTRIPAFRVGGLGLGFSLNVYKRYLDQFPLGGSLDYVCLRSDFGNGAFWDSR